MFMCGLYSFEVISPIYSQTFDSISHPEYIPFCHFFDVTYLMMLSINFVRRSKNNNGITECGEHCRQRRRELEGEAQQLRREIKSGEDRLRAMEMEIQQYQQLRRAQQQAANSPSQQQQQHQQQMQQQQLQQQQQQQQQQIQQQQQQQLQQQQQQQQQQQHHHQQHHNVETELLVSALSALQDKTSHLESSLSAETRIKLDLFSALGEAKKQLEQRESISIVDFKIFL
jgi:hypothetical protein